MSPNHEQLKQIKSLFAELIKRKTDPEEETVIDDQELKKLKEFRDVKRKHR